MIPSSSRLFIYLIIISIILSLCKGIKSLNSVSSCSVKYESCVHTDCCDGFICIDTDNTFVCMAHVSSQRREEEEEEEEAKEELDRLKELVGVVEQSVLEILLYDLQKARAKSVNQDEGDMMQVSFSFALTISRPDTFVFNSTTLRCLEKTFTEILWLNPIKKSGRFYIKAAIDMNNLKDSLVTLSINVPYNVLSERSPTTATNTKVASLLTLSVQGYNATHIFKEELEKEGIITAHIDILNISMIMFNNTNSVALSSTLNTKGSHDSPDMDFHINKLVVISFITIFCLCSMMVFIYFKNRETKKLNLKLNRNNLRIRIPEHISRTSTLNEIDDIIMNIVQKSNNTESWPKSCVQAPVELEIHSMYKHRYNNSSDSTGTGITGIPFQQSSLELEDTKYKHRYNNSSDITGIPYVRSLEIEDTNQAADFRPVKKSSSVLFRDCNDNTFDESISKRSRSSCLDDSEQDMNDIGGISTPAPENEINLNATQCPFSFSESMDGSPILNMVEFSTIKNRTPKFKKNDII